MSPRRFRLDGATLGEVKQRVTQEHGAAARIVAVEQVTTGGLGGFFASRRFEVTVEVPDGPSPAVDAHDLGDSRIAGIAALLDEADAAESALSAPPVGTVLRDESELVSTSTRTFAEVLHDLQAVTETEPQPPAPEPPPGARPSIIPPSPTLLDGAGDLVVVVGFAGDALAVARAMSFTVQAELVVSGAAVAEGLERIGDRRDAITARARGVRAERVVVAAFGVSGHDPLPGQAQAVAELKPDQVWVAVDAGRKHDDTARWVHALAAVLAPEAVAAIGRHATATPDSVRELGIPVSWSYDR